MPSVVAYALSVAAMPLVGLAVIVPSMFLTGLAQVADPVADRAATLLGHALSAFVMMGVSRLIFGWLEVPFSAGPVIAVGVVLILFDFQRVAMALRQWAGWLEAHGIPAQLSGDALFEVTRSDLMALRLYRQIGDALACTVGSLLGIITAGWWFLFA